MKKQFVSFVFYDNSYITKKFNSDKMSLLGAFFSIDYPLYKFSDLIQWAKKSESYFTNANITFFEQEQGRVVIGDLYDTNFPRLTFSLPVEKFVKLLQDWERVAGTIPKEIIITKEGDKVIVKGRS